MKEVLMVTDLGKKYSQFELKNINFALPKGHIMGLIGPNGSGKTTTIKLILNLLKRTSGSVKIFEQDNIEHEIEIKEQMGIVFDSSFYMDEWRIMDVEKVIGRFYEKWDKKKFYSFLKQFNLEPGKRVKELSKGMQMKLMLASAFSYDAKLLILDEPTSGLDPVSRDELMNILCEYVRDGEHSILFSTHITSDLEKVADYITYINFGKMIYTGSKQEFIDSFHMITGSKEELPEDEVKKKMMGFRQNHFGYEALMYKEDSEKYSELHKHAATIDDIIVFTSQRGENND